MAQLFLSLQFDGGKGPRRLLNGALRFFNRRRLYFFRILTGEAPADSFTDFLLYHGLRTVVPAHTQQSSEALRTNLASVLISDIPLSETNTPWHLMKLWSNLINQKTKI